jgi:TolB-like protein
MPHPAVIMRHLCRLCLLRLLMTLWLGDPVALAADTPRLAVLDFDYVAADRDAAHLGKGLQQMLTTDLEKVAGLPMVERGRLRDILAELKLSETPYVDAQEAVKVGRLAGATHLVTGSIVIDSGTMRIDIRIVAVETGKVLFAEEVSGERDAFWELEKGIVRLTIDRLGLKPTAAERAALSRVHTPRFDNFTAFSQAIDLADRKQYPAAVAVLKRLSEVDEDFVLAKTTLAEYEQLLQKLEARALALQEQQDQLVFSTATDQAKTESAALASLAQLVDRQIASPQDRLRRSEAIYLLAKAYSGYDYCPGLRKVADSFAMARAASHYSRLYWNEAIDLFPAVPPITSSYFGPPTRSDFLMFPQSLQLTEINANPLGLFRPKEVRYFTTILHATRRLHLDSFLNRLEVDLPQRIHIIETVLKMLSNEWQIAASDNAYEEHVGDLWSYLANCYRGNADFAGSTACFTKLALRSKDADGVRAITKEVDLDKRLADAFKKCPDRIYAEECARLFWAEDHLHRDMESRFLLELVSETPGKSFNREGGALGLRGAVRAKRAMRFGYDIEGYQAFSYRMCDVPAWLVRKGEADVATGPRKGPYSFDELEYFESKMHSDVARRGGVHCPTFLIIGGSKSDQSDLKITFDVRRPGEWQRWEKYGEDFLAAIDLSEELDLMQVGVIFGVRDVNNESRKAYPMTGEAIVLRRGRIEHARFTEANDEPGKTSHATPFRWDVIAQQPYKGPVNQVHALGISLHGEVVTVTASGEKYSFKRAAADPGFAGVVIQGPGYVKLSGLAFGDDTPATAAKAP